MTAAMRPCKPALAMPKAVPMEPLQMVYPWHEGGKAPRVLTADITGTGTNLAKV